MRGYYVSNLLALHYPLSSWARTEWLAPHPTSRYQFYAIVLFIATTIKPFQSKILTPASSSSDKWWSYWEWVEANKLHWTTGAKCSPSTGRDLSPLAKAWRQMTPYSVNMRLCNGWTSFTCRTSSQTSKPIWWNIKQQQKRRCFDWEAPCTTTVCGTKIHVHVPGLQYETANAIRDFEYMNQVSTLSDSARGDSRIFLQVAFPYPGNRPSFPFNATYRTLSRDVILRVTSCVRSYASTSSVGCPGLTANERRIRSAIIKAIHKKHIRHSSMGLLDSS